MTDAGRTAQTYRYERWRAVYSGILETAGNTGGQLKVRLD